MSAFLQSLVQDEIVAARAVLTRVEDDAKAAQELQTTAKKQLEDVGSRLKDGIARIDAAVAKTQEFETRFAVLSGKAQNLEDLLFANREVSQTDLSNTGEILGKVLDRLDRIEGQQLAVEKPSPGEPEAPAKAAVEVEKANAQVAASREYLAQRMAHGRYTVYIHYPESLLSNAKLASELSTFLTDAGFVVPEPRPVAVKTNSIRYAHADDSEGAKILREYTLEFAAQRRLSAEFRTKPIPEFKDVVRKGVIELWMSFDG